MCAFYFQSSARDLPNTAWAKRCQGLLNHRSVLWVPWGRTTKKRMVQTLQMGAKTLMHVYSEYLCAAASSCRLRGCRQYRREYHHYSQRAYTGAGRLGGEAAA
jgi:hypothetical protein